MTNKKQTNPLDELLRARLRIKDGSEGRIRALRLYMQSADWVSRSLFGQPFFAMKETEALLIELDGRTGSELIDALLAMKGGTTIRPHGLHHIPATGPVVIGSTHPVGTFDFIAHAAALLDHRPDLKVVAGRETERFLGPERIVAVDFDRKDKVLSARKTRAGMMDHLEEGGALLVFGSGRVPRMERGLLVEPPWRTGTTHVSAARNAPIIPASVDMRNSAYYYGTRKWVGRLSGGNDELGRRIASLRYVSELIALLGGTYDAYYGPPQPAGTPPAQLKALAEGLVPGLYASPTE